MGCDQGFTASIFSLGNPDSKSQNDLVAMLNLCMKVILADLLPHFGILFPRYTSCLKPEPTKHHHVPS